jgi:hypothetical protein
MKRKMLLIILAIIVFATALLVDPTRSRAQESKFQHTQNPIPNQYIVVLRPEIAPALVASTAQSLASTYGGQLGFVYEYVLKGFSIQTTEATAILLSNHSSVDYVIEDSNVGISGTQLNPPSWGLDRIDQRDLSLNNAYTYKPTGAGVHAYVIDTGIRTTHQEFHGRASIAADFVGDGQNGYDCAGHGTAVASIIGGSTFGVAKGVTLHSVRVLGCYSFGPVSTIVAGINWVTFNRISPAVVNLSLDGPGNRVLDQAVSDSISSGLTYVVAAGNQGVNAVFRSPARVESAITVGATDISDSISFFSNYGGQIDLFAPGDSITGAWGNSDTAQLTDSGTSLAAPHVAGVVAQYLQLNPGASPALVRNTVVDNATVGRVTNLGLDTPNRLLCSNFLILPPRATSTDFDGDLKTDTALWRPSDDVWYIYFRATDTWSQMLWGSQGDQIVPGDYDGDRKADRAVWRPSTGIWSIFNSSNSTQRFQFWGLSGDIPVPADYDGDAKTDLALWRPSDGTWYIIESATGLHRGGAWGMAGDKPVAADYDGDGKADLAVWRPSNGVWYIIESSIGTVRSETFGGASFNDVLVPSDYDGDGSADIAVWRPSTGVLSIMQSSTGTLRYETWGISGDLPVMADYDGDDKSDVAVWRPGNGVWYILQSSTGTVRYETWGLSGDLPIPSAYNRY